MQEQILQALHRRDLEQAGQLAAEWAAQQPTLAAAHRLHALTLQQQGSFEPALESLERALALAPDDADLHLQHAGLLLALRRLDAAGDALDRSTGANPNTFPAYLMQAHLALGRGDVDEAERQMRLAARLEEGHPELATLAGMMALRRGALDEALAQLSAAAKALPDDPRVLHALGFAYLGKDMLAFAEQAFRRVLELNPGITRLEGLVVQLALRQGNVEAAASMLEHTLARSGDDAIGLRRLAAQLALQSGQPMQALEHLRPHLANHAADRQLLQLLLMAWQRLGREDEARAALDAALAAPGNDQVHDLWLARLAVEGVGSDAAVAVVERWLAAMPDYLPALETRMRLHEMAGQGDEVERIAARIVALEPGRASGEARLVDALLARDPAAAIARVESLVARAEGPARDGLLTWLGEVHDRAGQPREALRTWLDLHASQAAQRLPLPPQAKAPASWPPLGEVAADTDAAPVAAPMFLWGAPGSGVERVAATLAGPSPVFRDDRFGPKPPNDPLQNYHTLQRLASGELSPEALVAQWQEGLVQRGLPGGAVIDWLLWWDNALLWALRPQLPQGRLLAVIRDPRDMLLEWIAYGAAVPLAVHSLNDAAEWLARALSQLATLHEQDLYPHLILRVDNVGNDPQAMAGLLQEVFNVRIPPAQSLGAPRMRPGHWLRYREAMGPAFDLLTPVAVRLGYPEN